MDEREDAPRRALWEEVGIDVDAQFHASVTLKLPSGRSLTFARGSDGRVWMAIQGLGLSHILDELSPLQVQTIIKALEAL